MIIRHLEDIEVCECCENPIWNPDWWGETGMCGCCSTGESAELFHEDWIAPYANDVSDSKDLFQFWQIWYEGIYLKGVKPPKQDRSREVLGLKV